MASFDPDRDYEACFEADLEYLKGKKREEVQQENEELDRRARDEKKQEMDKWRKQLGLINIDSKASSGSKPGSRSSMISQRSASPARDLPTTARSPRDARDSQAPVSRLEKKSAAPSHEKQVSISPRPMKTPPPISPMTPMSLAFRTTGTQKGSFDTRYLESDSDEAIRDSSVAPALTDDEVYKTYPTPNWITNSVRYQARKESVRDEPVQDRKDMGQIITCIKDLRDPSRRAEYHSNLNKLRDLLHEFEYRTVNGAAVIRSGILDPHQNGLAMLQGANLQGRPFPPDVRGDSLILLQKWADGEFDSNIMRGIDKSGRNRAIMKSYSFRRNPHAGGHNRIANGQWWPFQICALRDGAHGETQAGIHGYKGEGAFSIVISGSNYEDVDNGSKVKYTGTRGMNGKMTEDTGLLFESLHHKTPVRVLRSSSLGGTYAPKVGLRYDGLYDVISAELLNRSTQHYRFDLTRQPGQDPIRWHGVYARPTDQDCDAFYKERRNIVDVVDDDAIDAGLKLRLKE